MNQKEIAAPFVTQREDSFQNRPKFGWFRSTFLVESYEYLLRNPLVSATSLDDHLLIFNFMALGIFLLSRSPENANGNAPVVSNGNSEFLSKNRDHGMELLTFDDIDSPVVPVGESNAAAVSSSSIRATCVLLSRHWMFYQYIWCVYIDINICALYIICFHKRVHDWKISLHLYRTSKSTLITWSSHLNIFKIAIFLQHPQNQGDQSGHLQPYRPVRIPLCQAVARASNSTAFKRLQVTYCTWNRGHDDLPTQTSCIVITKIPQNCHRFVFFHSPRMGNLMTPVERVFFWFRSKLRQRNSSWGCLFGDWCPKITSI